MRVYTKLSSVGSGKKCHDMVEYFLKEAQSILDEVSKEHNELCSDRNSVYENLTRLSGLLVVCQDTIGAPDKYAYKDERNAIHINEDPVNIPTNNETAGSNVRKCIEGV